ncbi:alpha/beta fold hydrolase [Promicromonospora sukumoe]|uniref:Pimeloyl-ACP methyl ester carboxylesterase n=1 Tax=Promicromonospora sukumoe TaxID=88382 RepID=A0A7W3PCE2_9MICO|nr:alpha/beta hydrolase [Promicromonospora sukumoe]MBA8806561.1 pimeloyl-ACP methyl ester carboxylesterase [Promicromonospora sukumoe]
MNAAQPDTVVLVHGLWMTPRSWEAWVDHYRAKGLNVVTPGYPGFEVEVEALREDPDIIARLTVPETVDHLAGVIEALPSKPIIIGHSFGGTLTQLLLARGLGAAGVVIDSAPTEGVRVSPLSQARSLFPALKNPANRHRAVGFTPEEFHYAFTNTLSEEESRQVWERYAIAAPGHWVWEYGLFANFKPGPQETWVDYAADRAPLLFIAGSEDHIMPPAVNRSNAKHYDKSPAVTEYYEFEGRDHWTCGAEGWQEVADHALAWAQKHASADKPVA